MYKYKEECLDVIEPASEKKRSQIKSKGLRGFDL